MRREKHQREQSGRNQQAGIERHCLQQARQEAAVIDGQQRKDVVDIGRHRAHRNLDHA
ncbi:hypothetical protein D9M68_465010 [compost metagenome]